MTKLTPNDFAACILVTKDDFCLFEVCKRLYEEGVRSFFFAIPNEYWSGDITSKSAIDEVRQISQELKLAFLGANVNLNVVDVKPHRKPGLRRTQVEASVRNEVLRIIRGHGLNHVLVVDGDELWRRGYVKKLVDLVSRERPRALSLGMIPTIGVPGLPIEGATDSATAYLGPDSWHTECRGVEGAETLLNPRAIIHFTATRKTMDEVIRKHRASGHYDDPSYAFEDWFVKTLPFIKPGMRNVHMFTPYQIWPLVRDWSLDEWNEIPESIRPYLQAPSQSHRDATR